MPNINLCLDNKKFSSKPEPADAAVISAGIAGRQTSISFNDFINALGQGRTYCPGTFKRDVRKASQWVGQQIFVADIDDGNIPLADIITMIDSFDLPAAVLHESFSSSAECRKWRVIFISDKVITDPVDALAVLRKIQQHFESDSCVIDLARLLYATTADKIHIKNEVYFSYSSIDLEHWHKPPVRHNGRSAAASLPAKSANSNKAKFVLGKATMKINACVDSRYQCVWQSARMMAQSKLFSEKSIKKEIIKIATQSVNFDLDEWDKDINAVIDNAIAWGKCHTWED